MIDAPGGGGKIPVMPNYLISYSDHKVVLRNYEGYITTYEEPTRLPAPRPFDLRVLPNARPEPGQSGVHGLLQGDRMWIEPRGFEEIHARGNVEQHRLQDPSKWVPYGVGAIEGQARTPLPGPAAGQRQRDVRARARSRARARASRPLQRTASCCNRAGSYCWRRSRMPSSLPYTSPSFVSPLALTNPTMCNEGLLAMAVLDRVRKSIRRVDHAGDWWAGEAVGRIRESDPLALSGDAVRGGPEVHEAA